MKLYQIISTFETSAPRSTEPSNGEPKKKSSVRAFMSETKRALTSKEKEMV